MTDWVSECKVGTNILQIIAKIVLYKYGVCSAYVYVWYERVVYEIALLSNQ